MLNAVNIRPSISLIMTQGLKFLTRSIILTCFPQNADEQMFKVIEWFHSIAIHKFFR